MGLSHEVGLPKGVGLSQWVRLSQGGAITGGGAITSGGGFFLIERPSVLPSRVSPRQGESCFLWGGAGGQGSEGLAGGRSRWQSALRALRRAVLWAHSVSQGWAIAVQLELGPLWGETPDRRPSGSLPAFRLAWSVGARVWLIF